MLSRKNDHLFSDKKNIFEEITTRVEKIIQKNYSKQCKGLNKELQLFSFLYQNEFLLIVSIKDTQRISPNLPISLFISVDMDTDSEQNIESENMISPLIDFAQPILDSILKDKNLEIEYMPHWEQSNRGKNVLFYKISREDVPLTIQSEKL